MSNYYKIFPFLLLLSVLLYVYSLNTYYNYNNLIHEIKSTILKNQSNIQKLQELNSYFEKNESLQEKIQRKQFTIHHSINDFKNNLKEISKMYSFQDFSIYLKDKTPFKDGFVHLTFDLHFTAQNDADVWAFLSYLTNEFIGFNYIQTLSIQRISSLSDDTLDKIATGLYIPLFQVDLRLGILNR